MDIITQNAKAKVTINNASWSNMCRLKQEAFKCIDVHNMPSFDGLDNASFLTFWAEIIIKAETSDSFNNALFDCLKFCLYNDSIAITQQLLEDKPELLEDYYEIASNCIEVNLHPFIKSLRTEFLRRLQAMAQKNQE